MKRILGTLAFILVGAGLASAAPICPTTSNTNTDCGYILTIGAGNTITGAAVPGAAPYDGGDDALVGVINNSGATFTGTISLSGTGNGGGIFAFDGDGICTFIGPGAGNASATGSYCSGAAAGTDPADYQGPINTFSNITSMSEVADTGDVDIVGLADGASTFFSLESSPDSIVLAPPVVGSSVTPEPSSLVLLSTGLIGAATGLRRKLTA